VGHLVQPPCRSRVTCSRLHCHTAPRGFEPTPDFWAKFCQIQGKSLSAHSQAHCWAGEGKTRQLVGAAVLAEGEQKRVDSRGAGSVQCSRNAASTGDSIAHAVSAAGPAEPRGWAGSARMGVPALAGCREGAGLTAAGPRHSGCQRAALAREGLLRGTERRLRGPWNSAPLLSLAKQEVGHFISDPVAFAARKVFSRGRGFF